MATSFPQLLRRSKFASHDPLITRVYNSTPSSVYQHGDWGMKFPIHRSKGPKHISVNSLDTGTILGSDWRSAEKEARFVENWGRAGRWTPSDKQKDKEDREQELAGGMPSATRRRIESYVQRDLEAEQKAAELKQRMEAAMIRVPDVNAMSKREFERYIATVRRERGQFLATKLEGMRETARGKKEAEHESNPTLIGLAARGLASPRDPAHFQSNLTHREMESTESDQIHSTTHRMYGLTYSSPTPSSSNPPVKGRILNQFKPEPRFRYSHHDSTDDNRNFVASVGGVTAKLDTASRKTRDAPLEKTDFTRANRSAGETMFSIASTDLKSPPTVQHLAQDLRAAQWNNRGGFGRPIRQSGAAQPSPLDTARFEIKLRDVDSGSDAEAQSIEWGSKEWVAQEPRRRTSFSSEDVLGLSSSLPTDLGIGKPKADRSRGDVLNQLGSYQAQADRRAADKKSEEGNVATGKTLVQRLRARAEAGDR